MNKKKSLAKIFLIIIVLSLLFVKEISIFKTQKDKLRYGFTLEEIGERIQYIYKYENTLKIQTLSQFGELGKLPQGKSVDTHIYLTKGNRILFLPESRANTKLNKADGKYNAYYSKKMQGYLFYLLCDWETHEAGIPLNSLENSTIKYCIVTEDYSTLQNDKNYGLEDLSYLGKIQVDFTKEIAADIYPIEVSGNGYVNVMVEYITEILSQEGEYGEYVIYLNDMHRVQREKRSFGETECYLDCVIEGNGRKEYAEFLIYDHGDIDGEIFPLSGPHLADSLGYFSDYYSEEENRELIQTIIDQNRGVVTLSITSQTKEIDRKKQSNNAFEYKNDMDFSTMSAKEIATLLSYVCSYSEWFGLAELGYRVGEFREFDGKEIILYSWANAGDKLFFIPADHVNTILKKKDGEVCPVYVNKTGDMEFYKLEKKQFADRTGQMNTSLITIDNLATCYIEYFVRIGETEKISIEDLIKLEIPPVKKDMFVRAFTQKIEELLKQAEKKGTYTVQIGEYESVYSNQVCISAAVIGKQDAYYIRYLIVAYGDDQYYFWPVGFGIDGSLEECASTKHGMNRTCIERTKQLNRTNIKIVLE